MGSGCRGDYVKSFIGEYTMICLICDPIFKSNELESRHAYMDLKGDFNRESKDHPIDSN